VCEAIDFLVCVHEEFDNGCICKSNSGGFLQAYLDTLTRITAAVCRRDKEIFYDPFGKVCCKSFEGLERGLFDPPRGF